MNKTINGIQSFLPELFPENFGNYLEVENYRKNLFLMCCSMKITVENISANIKKLSSNDKLTCTEESAQSVGDLKVFNTENETMINISYLIEPIHEEDEFISSDSFLQLRQGLMNFPNGRENLCIPVDENDNLSIIAYTLNTQEYHDKVVSAINGSDDLVEITESDKVSCLHFEHVFTNFFEDELSQHSYRDDITKLYGNHITIAVTFYFAKQFHFVRNFTFLTEKEIILSLSKSEVTSSQLGKSKALFKFSSDRRFLTKILDEKRFQMFLDMAPSYFRHIYMTFNHSMPSCLVKIIGAYKIQIKNHTTGKTRNE